MKDNENEKNHVKVSFHRVWKANHRHRNIAGFELRSHSKDLTDEEHIACDGEVLLLLLSTALQSKYQETGNAFPIICPKKKNSHQ